jgi:hypothetical protein
LFVSRGECGGMIFFSRDESGYLIGDNERFGAASLLQTIITKVISVFVEPYLLLGGLIVKVEPFVMLLAMIWGLVGGWKHATI